MASRKLSRDIDLVFTVRNVLKDRGYQEVFAVNRARVPVVKFVDPMVEVRRHGVWWGRADPYSVRRGLGEERSVVGNR